jgi:hypothetical protein
MKALPKIVLAAWLATMPAGVLAHDAYDDSQSHPLQLAAYALHPVGLAIEWLVMRPIHFPPYEPDAKR